MSGPLAWITGAGGLIGSHVVRVAPTGAPDWKVAALSRAAACQANPALAEVLNVSVTRHLCELAKGIPFVFFSTDLVFDGRKGKYSEADSPNPLSVYAQSKLRAEEIVLRNPLHTVVRTSLTAGVSPTGDKSFTEQMRDAWRRGETLKLFTDEFRSPIAAAITARAI